MALPRRPFRLRTLGLVAGLGAFVLAASVISPAAPATAAATVSISGTLKDAAGSPAWYHHVAAYEYVDADTWGPQVASVRTGLDGDFRLDGLEPGRQYRISGHWNWGALPSISSFGGFFRTDAVDTMTREPSLAALFTPGPDGITGLSLHLEPSTTLSGRVVDQDGAPIAGVEVQGITDTTLRDPIRYGSHLLTGKATTGADGTFRLSGLEYVGDELEGWFLRTGPAEGHHGFLGSKPANGLVPVDQARMFPPTVEPVTGVEIVMPEPRLPADQIVLGPMTAVNPFGSGDVLAVGSGTLTAYGVTYGGAITSSHAIRTGFDDEQIYAPGDWGGAALDWIENEDAQSLGFRPYPDLVSVDTSGDMYLYEGNGHGYLREPRKIGQGWNGYRVIPAGDLTGEGYPDLLAIDPNGYLKLYRSNGKGGFLWPYPQVGRGWNGYDLYAAEDLNLDGRNDILSVDSVGDLYMYAGNGNGTFNGRVKVGRGWGTYTLASGADIDGYVDETTGYGIKTGADIVGRDDTTGDLYLYSGSGNGRFPTKQLIATGW